MYGNTRAAESVVGHIGLVSTHFHPFLAKNDRVLPIVSTLLIPPVFGNFMFPSGRLIEQTSTDHKNDFSLNN